MLVAMGFLSILAVCTRNPLQKLLVHIVKKIEGILIIRGATNRVFGKPCFGPLPKRGRFDENGENDEFALYPAKTRVWLLRPPKTTKMTKMAGVTQEKAWFSGVEKLTRSSLKGV